MKVEYLFLERCKQVDLLLESHKEIDIIDLSARLRQLILDKHCLVSAVNTNRIKLQFEVGFLKVEPFSYESQASFRSLEDGLDPETSLFKRDTKILNIDEFISHTVMIIDRKNLTVKDIIRNISNVSGGVHYDPHPKKEYELLQEVASLFYIGGLPAGIRILKAISRVFMRGILPLIEDVKFRMERP